MILFQILWFSSHRNLCMWCSSDWEECRMYYRSTIVLLPYQLEYTMQIKWICPTAPIRPVALLGGFPCTACKILLYNVYVQNIVPWFITYQVTRILSCVKKFRLVNTNEEIWKGCLCLSGFDVGEISETAPDDLEGLDASAAHVANLLSTEPANSRFLPFIVLRTLKSWFCMYGII